MTLRKHSLAPKKPLDPDIYAAGAVFFSWEPSPARHRPGFTEGAPLTCTDSTLTSADPDWAYDYYNCHHCHN